MPPPTNPRTIGGVREVRRRVVAGIALIVFGIVVWSTRSTAVDAIRAMKGADWRWLLAGLAGQIVMYVTLGALLTTLLGRQLSITPMTGIGFALVVFGFGGIMPASPAEGMSAAVIELGRRGAAVGTAARTLVLAEWERFVALALLVAVDQVIAVLNGRPLQLELPVALALSAFTIGAVVAASRVVRGRRVATTGARLAAWMRERHFALVGPAGSEPLTIRELLGEPRHRLIVLTWSAAGWMADAGCLAFCVKAMGDELGLDAVLLAYAIGAAVAIVPLLPGGLGAVEVAVPAVLHRMGLPLETAVAATLLWRGLALILPAIVGSVALVVLRRWTPDDATPITRS